MKIVAKFFGVIAVSTLGFMLFVATAFASPALEDANITFSVKGIYTQYALNTTWEAGKYVDASGNLNGNGAASFRLTDYIPVTPGGSVFIYRTDTFNLYGLYYVSFFDSEKLPVSGGINWNGSTAPQFCDVPVGASYCRITTNTSVVNAANMPYYFRIVSAPTHCDVHNYQYIWSAMDDITIASDGTITLPYQTNAYTYAMLDFRFFDSTFQFSSLAFNCLTTYTGGYFEGERLLEYGSGGISVDSYFIDDSGNMTVDGSIGYSESDNPYRCYAQIPYERFSGFRIFISLLPGQVSTSLKIKVYEFELDGVGTLVHLQMNSAINDLENIGDQLEVSSPDPSAIYQNINNITLQMQDSNFGALDWFGPTNGIVMSMMITVFTFAALGYILYGKR